MSDRNKKTLNINIRFAEINVSKYSQYDLENEFEKDRFPLVDFKSNFQFRVINDEEKLGCLITVKIVINETNEEFAELKVESIFEIKPFDNIKKSKSGEGYEIPDVLMFNIASLSVSTVRGILFEKLKGTIVQNEIYPLADLSTLFLNKKNLHEST